MKDSNHSFLRFLKPTKNGHSPDGVDPLPSDWPDFRTSLKMRELLVAVETKESELHEHKVDVKLKILDGGLRTLGVLTVVGGEIVLLATHPAFFVLNLPGLFAYGWWQGKKRSPDERGGGP